MPSERQSSDCSASETERAILTLCQIVEKQTRAIENMCVTVAALLDAIVDQDEQEDQGQQDAPVIGLNGKPIN